MHQFEVRVVTTAGEKWKGEPVRARTAPKAHVRPPGFGRFGKSYSLLSAAQIANPAPPGKFPPHNGFMVFIGSALFTSRGDGASYAWEISGDRERVRLGTPIFLSEASHADASSGFQGVDQFLCSPAGPPATYRWSAARGRAVFEYDGNPEYASNLTLQAVDEPCVERQRLLEGVWEGFNAG